MSSLPVALIVLVCLLGGAVLGMVVREVLPKEHLSDEAKDVIKLGTGLLATLAALVLGLLIASARSSIAVKADEIEQAASKVIQLDHILRRYGPEANEARDLQRRLFTARADLVWTKAGTSLGTALGGGTSGIEEVQEKLRALVPTSDAQRWLQARALQLTIDLEQIRWLMVEQSGSAIPVPFLFVLVLWLVVIFMSFGLLAPRRGIVLVSIVASALSVSSAIFLILELDRPFAGLLKTSDAPIRDAITEINR